MRKEKDTYRNIIQDKHPQMGTHACKHSHAPKHTKAKTEPQSTNFHKPHMEDREREKKKRVTYMTY